MFRLIILQQFLTDIKTRLLYVFRRVWTGYSLPWWSCMPTSRRGWNAVSHCCPLFGSFFLSFDFSHILNHLPGAPRGTSHLFHTTPYICLNQFSTSLCSFPHVFEPTKWAWLNCLIRTERTASSDQREESWSLSEGHTAVCPYGSLHHAETGSYILSWTSLNFWLWLHKLTIITKCVTRTLGLEKKWKRIRSVVLLVQRADRTTSVCSWWWIPQRNKGPDRDQSVQCGPG